MFPTPLIICPAGSAARRASSPHAPPPPPRVRPRSATLNAGGDINVIEGGTNPGGDFSGSIDAGGRVGGVTVHAGSLMAPVTAGTDVGDVLAHGSIMGRITAGLGVGNVTAQQGV